MKPNIKKAIESAEKELKEEQENKTKEEIKKIIKAILEKLENAQEKRQEAVKEIQIHKKMLDYLKKGDLEKIKEMLETDEFARKVAVVIIKEKETTREKEVLTPNPWTNPWDKWYITWNATDNSYFTDTPIDNMSNSITLNMLNDTLELMTFSEKQFRDYVSGSYSCYYGKVYHITK